MRTADGATGAAPRPEHQDPLLAWIDVRVLPQVSEDPVVVDVEVPLTDRVRNSAGVLNGGIVATVMDMAGGVAAARATGTRAISTSAMNVQYVAPVRVGPARARATVVRTGRRSVVASLELVDDGDDGRVAAIGTISLVVRED